MRTSSRPLLPPRFLRPDWVRRLAAWVCLLSLVFGQALPPAFAGLSAPQWQGDSLICHAGGPPPAPAKPSAADPSGGHCPLCVLLVAQAVTPPLQAGSLALPLPPRFIALALLPPADARPAANAATQPRHARAPPSGPRHA